MDKNLTVLYEDNQIVVVLKPQNILSQSDITKDEDLLSMVKAYIKEKYNKAGNAFIGLVIGLTDLPRDHGFCKKF